MNLLKLALQVKSSQSQSYLAAFAPTFVLFALLLLLFLGFDAANIIVATLAAFVMGGLAVVALWFFTEAQVDGVLALLEYRPQEKFNTQTGLEKAQARVKRIFTERNLELYGLSISENAVYCPKPFVAVLLKPSPQGGCVASIVFDTERTDARAVAQILAANLRIE